jgi:hypothetical protein
MIFLSIWLPYLLLFVVVPAGWIDFFYFSFSISKIWMLKNVLIWWHHFKWRCIFFAWNLNGFGSCTDIYEEKNVNWPKTGFTSTEMRLYVRISWRICAFCEITNYELYERDISQSQLSLSLYSCQSQSSKGVIHWFSWTRISLVHFSVMCKKTLIFLLDSFSSVYIIIDFIYM